MNNPRRVGDNQTLGISHLGGYARVWDFLGKVARSSRRPRLYLAAISSLRSKVSTSSFEKREKKDGVTRENAITTLRPMFKRRLYISCNGSGKNYVWLQSKDAMFRENDVSSRNRRMQHDSQEVEITSGKNALVSREIGRSFDAILLPLLLPFSTRLLFLSFFLSFSLSSFFSFFLFFLAEDATSYRELCCRIRDTYVTRDCARGMNYLIDVR